MSLLRHPPQIAGSDDVATLHMSATIPPIRRTSKMSRKVRFGALPANVRLHILKIVYDQCDGSNQRLVCREWRRTSLGLARRVTLASNMSMPVLKHCYSVSHIRLIDLETWPDDGRDGPERLPLPHRVKQITVTGRVSPQIAARLCALSHVETVEIVGTDGVFGETHVLRALAPFFTLWPVSVLYAGDARLDRGTVVATAPFVAPLSKTLTTLDISCNNLGARDVATIVKHLTRVHTLDIALNPVGRGFYTSGLGRAICDLPLRYLDATGIQLVAAGDSPKAWHGGLETIVRPGMTQLALSGNCLNDRTMLALMGPASGTTWRDLTYLDLSSNGLTIVSIAALARAASKLASLRVLYLNDNRVGPQACMSIATILQYARHIVDLRLDGMGVHVVGAVYLIAGLRGLRLKRLGMSRNDLGDGGAHAVALGIAPKSRDSLAELDLTRNNLSWNGVDSIVGVFGGYPPLAQLGNSPVSRGRTM